MNNSIVIRVLKKDNYPSIAQARASVEVEHEIVYQGEATGCTVDATLFNVDNEFYPDAYVIIGVKD
jgi:hypothetical protein